MFSFHVIPKTGQGERPDQISYNLQDGGKQVLNNPRILRNGITLVTSYSFKK